MTATNSTAELMKARNIEKMGQELGTEYTALWNELVSVHRLWSEYVVLFGTDESRIDCLNSAAPVFFKLVQDSIWENVLLHIVRLTDSLCTNGKKKNLTIRRLPDLIDRDEFKEIVKQKVEVAKEKCDFARDWRNRHIAHNDHGLKASCDAPPLKPASREHIDHALAALLEVLNTIAAEYLNANNYFDKLGGDALKLLKVIDDGLLADKQHRE